MGHDAQLLCERTQVGDVQPMGEGKGGLAALPLRLAALHRHSKIEVVTFDNSVARVFDMPTPLPCMSCLRPKSLLLYLLVGVEECDRPLF